MATLNAVLDHGSFSAAAHALGLTQPAVSRQVSLLERRLGTQLVRRTQHGVHPTEAGMVLVGHTEVILDRLQLAEAQIADLVGLRTGRVRLGSFLTALIHLSSELSTRLQARHPELFHGQRQVIEDVLVDRTAALRGLASRRTGRRDRLRTCLRAGARPASRRGDHPAVRRSALRVVASHASARRRPGRHCRPAPARHLDPRHQGQPLG